ncbi:hypothetical protein, partial [Xanthomonas sp. LMG 12461]|uniref:hypothetical protein n=1 Tax=Xanthomonas sp. LMG 12461 TaxID=2014543 RepID=UPI001D05A395
MAANLEREARKARCGVCFLLVTFLCTSKEKEPSPQSETVCPNLLCPMRKTVVTALSEKNAICPSCR